MNSLKITLRNICNGFCGIHSSPDMWTYGKLNLRMVLCLFILAENTNM